MRQTTRRPDQSSSMAATLTSTSPTGSAQERMTVSVMSLRWPAARRIYPAGALWVAWPRRAAGHRSDITDAVIREHALPIGLVDVKVAAIDDDWSGLRVVWRTEHRR